MGEQGLFNLEAIKKVLGLNLPEMSEPPSELDIKNFYDQRKIERELQDKQNPIKGSIRSGIDNVWNFLGGMTGLNQAESLEADPATAYGELAGGALDAIPGKAVATGLGKAALGIAQAGLPFAAYIPKIKQKFDVPYLVHGTKSKDFEQLNFNQFDKHDVLGSAFHATPQTEYANQYAMGSSQRW